MLSLIQQIFTEQLEGPGTALGTGDTTASKAVKILCPSGIYIIVQGDTKNKKNIWTVRGNSATEKKNGFLSREIDRECSSRLK